MNKTQKTWATQNNSLFTSIPALLATLTGAGLLACSTQAAKADVIFTETFSANASNWRIDSGGTLATWVSTGGPLGLSDGYITRTTPTSGSTIMFRGQDNFDASGDGFVRNWLASDVSSFSIDIRQDAGIDLSFTLRFASSLNFPGASTVAFSVPSGVWTSISFPIIDSASVFQTYEGSNFNAIFSAIGNVQLSLVTLPTSPINLSIDNPTIVPEPSTFAVAGLGLALLGGMNRRVKKTS